VEHVEEETEDEKEAERQKQEAGLFRSCFNAHPDVHGVQELAWIERDRIAHEEFLKRQQEEERLALERAEV
jgi:hypothetical protein